MAFSAFLNPGLIRPIIVWFLMPCFILLVEGGNCASAAARPTLSSLTLSAANVAGGNLVQGTVTLTSSARKKGAEVALSVDNPSAATVPATVAIASKAASATFAITTHSVSASTTVTISAVYKGSTKTATLIVTAPDPSPAGAQFYVAVNGSQAGDGSKERPWDLQTALSHPPAVKPGATIWLRGGIYTRPWTSKNLYHSNLTGAPQSPIVVRQHPGERAIIDGGSSPTYKDHHALRIDGAHAWFWGFEVMYSNPQRLTGDTGSSPVRLHRGKGVTVYGNYIKCINLVVHDAAAGFSFWTPGENSELYGCIIFYNGWESDRGHGHGIYSHNRNGIKRVKDCIMFKQFRNGIQVYNDESSDFIDNVVLEGNISFENGVLATSGYARNILYGGNGLARNPVIAGNYTYSNTSVDEGENNLGYNAGTENAQVTGNYFAGGRLALEVVRSSNLTLTGNTFIGDLEGFTQSQYPSNTYHQARPAGVWTFVLPNQYEQGRGHIAVYNWDNGNAVTVDVSSIGLEIGDAFEVMDVQDYFGSPVLTGVYDGRPITLPMNLTQVTLPVGNDLPVAVSHTSREFSAFVVRKRL